MERSAPLPRRRTKPRKGPPRDAGYLHFVRTQPCMVPGCRKRGEPHHFAKRGKGQKCSDYETVPLCHYHHLACWHSSAGLPGGTRGEWRERFRAKAAELLATYRSTRGKLLDEEDDLF